MSEATELHVDAVSTVRDFLKLLELGDVDGAFALADPAIEWRNTGMPTIRGDRVRKAWASMDRYNTSFAVDIHHIAGAGNVVLTERTDYLGKGKFKAGFWVCGTFELQGGKIVLWHDHFSYADAIRGTVLGAIGALRSR